MTLQVEHSWPDCVFFQLSVLLPFQPCYSVSGFSMFQHPLLDELRLESILTPRASTDYRKCVKFPPAPNILPPSWSPDKASTRGPRDNRPLSSRHCNVCPGYCLNFISEGLLFSSSDEYRNWKWLIHVFLVRKKKKATCEFQRGVVHLFFIEL